VLEKGRNEVTQVKRFSLAMLLMASALVATAAPAFAQVGVLSDPDQRWLLGIVIIALALIIAVLMAWYFLRKHRRRVQRNRNP
jgi:Na+/melibiose symporter-like transporter